MNLMMIIRLLFVILVLLGAAQFFDWVPTGGVWTGLHVIVGIAMFGLMEVIWSQRGSERTRL